MPQGESDVQQDPSLNAGSQSPSVGASKKIYTKSSKACKFQWVILTQHSFFCLATLMTPCGIGKGDRDTESHFAGDMTCGNDIVKTKLLHPFYILIKM